MADQHALVLQGPALALATRDVQRHSVLIVGDDVVELDPEGARRELQRPGEKAEDVVHATMITRQGAPARRMPDGVWTKQLTQGVDVALGERFEASADQLLVGMGHGSSFRIGGSGAYDLADVAHKDQAALAGRGLAATRSVPVRWTRTGSRLRPRPSPGLGPAGGDRVVRGCPVRRWIWVGPCDGSYGQAVTARSASGSSAVACSSAAARAGSSW